LQGLQQLLLLAGLDHCRGCVDSGVLLSRLRGHLLLGLLLPHLLLLWHIAVLCVVPIGSGRLLRQPDLLLLLLLRVLLLSSVLLLVLEAGSAVAARTSSNSALHPELLGGQLRVLLHVQLLLHVGDLHLLLRLLVVGHSCDKLHVVANHAVLAGEALHRCWPCGGHAHVLRPSDLPHAAVLHP
jgi:hypothetical protein